MRQQYEDWLRTVQSLPQFKDQDLRRIVNPYAFRMYAKGVVTRREDQMQGERDAIEIESSRATAMRSNETADRVAYDVISGQSVTGLVFDGKKFSFGENEQAYKEFLDTVRKP